MLQTVPGARPRVVIVGAGFGGLETARKLVRSLVDVTVIDRHNYHLFQPLLYQVATAALSPADIAAPIRVILRHQQNATVLLDEVIGIDAAARRVETRFGAAQTYDYLVVATGSQYTYFGHNDWPRLAPGLKSIDDATMIRRRVLLALLAHATLSRDFRHIAHGAHPAGRGRSARAVRLPRETRRFRSTLARADGGRGAARHADRGH